MKVIGLKVGENILNFPTYASFNAGTVTFAEVFADGTGTVTLKRGLAKSELTGSTQLASISVSNGYGAATVGDQMLSYGDKVTVTADFTMPENYVVRLFVQD